MADAVTLRDPTPAADIRLLISDVDGTLVTADKVLTPASVAAARDLRAAGLELSLISSRPPRGMMHVVEALGLTQPFAAFNGGAIVAPDGTVLEMRGLEPDVARTTLDLLIDGGVDAWVFAGDEWFLSNPAGHNVERERRTVRFAPIAVDDPRAVPGTIGKIVGVSSDRARLDAREATIHAALAGRASVSRSQPYYLDISALAATKGIGVPALSERIGVPLTATAVVGDMFNDIPMFDVAGLAIVMGQAPEPVKARAHWISRSNAEEGFAAAVADLLAARR